MAKRTLDPARRKKPPAERPLHQPAARIVPDWAAYFEAFCRAHAVEGGGFVLDGGALLFGDGWRYGDDYAGPEIPPPKDPTELADLLRRYWRRRRDIVRGERDALAFQLEGLTNLQRDRPLPVLVKAVVLNDWGWETFARDAEGHLLPSREPDWAFLVERLNWLSADVTFCERELDVLGE